MPCLRWLCCDSLPRLQLRRFDVSCCNYADTTAASARVALRAFGTGSSAWTAIGAEPAPCARKLLPCASVSLLSRCLPSALCACTLHPDVHPPAYVSRAATTCPGCPTRVAPNAAGATSRSDGPPSTHTPTQRARNEEALRRAVKGPSAAERRHPVARGVSPGSAASPRIVGATGAYVTPNATTTGARSPEASHQSE